MSVAIDHIEIDSKYQCSDISSAPGQIPIIVNVYEPRGTFILGDILSAEIVFQTGSRIPCRVHCLGSRCSGFWLDQDGHPANHYDYYQFEIIAPANDKVTIHEPGGFRDIVRTLKNSDPM